MSYKIFIGYRASDGVYCARLLYLFMKELGYEGIFLDHEQLKNGDAFNEIRRVIRRECEDFLFVVTPNALQFKEKDDVLLEELEIAAERKKADPAFNIVPVFTEGCDSFSNSELPKNLSLLLGMQSLEFYSNLPVEDFMKNVGVALERRLRAKPKRYQNQAVLGAYYDPVADEDRLILQSQSTEETDRILIGAIRSSLGKDSLSVLDVGCGSGSVTFSRFCAPCYQTVIGIDKNRTVIEQAQKTAAEKGVQDRFFFHQLDLESPKLSEELEEIMSERGVDAFDLVFLSFVTHFLSEDAVLEILSTLQEIMRPGAYIMIKNSDDGLKICDDDGTLDEILALTMQAAGVADRHTGRKLYRFLAQSDFEQIHVKPTVQSTESLHLRELNSLYEESFSYRADLFPDDPARTSRMSALLGRMKKNLKNKKWFCDVTIYATARKSS